WVRVASLILGPWGTGGHSESVVAPTGIDFDVRSGRAASRQLNAQANEWHQSLVSIVRPDEENAWVYAGRVRRADCEAGSVEFCRRIFDLPNTTVARMLHLHG